MQTHQIYRNGWRVARHSAGGDPEEDASDAPVGNVSPSAAASRAEDLAPAWVRHLSPIDEAEMSVGFGSIGAQAVPAGHL